MPKPQDDLEDEIRRTRKQANILAEEVRILQEHTDARAVAAHERARRSRERLERLLERERSGAGYREKFKCHHASKQQQQGAMFARLRRSPRLNLGADVPRAAQIARSSPAGPHVRLRIAATP
jgi:hypothetical protein